MIDFGRLRFNGRLNYQNGLLFYFSGYGRVISFYIDDIRDRKGKIRVTMHPDRNHGRAHVHVGRHDASFAVDTGELLAGRCDHETQRVVGGWIRRHRDDLQQLWDIISEGGRHEPLVDRIQRDRSFEDFDFGGEKPEKSEEIDGVKVWYDGDLIIDEDANNVKHVVCDGNLFVGLPRDYEEGTMVFESTDGRVQIKR